MKKYSLITCLVSILLLAGACNPYGQDKLTDVVVVESFLVAGNPLGSVYLSKAAPVNETYNFGNRIINQADVSISLLLGDEDSEIENFFQYRQDAQGIYVADMPHIVLPNRTYRLNVAVTGMDPITAVTTVPNTFTNRSMPPDSIMYQSADRIEVKIPKSDLADDLQHFIFTTIAEEPHYENLVPFYKEFIDSNENEDELADDLRRLSVGSSGIISEGNFLVDDQNNLVVQYPWVGIAFLGYNTIVAHLLDKNSYDFIRSQKVQLGGSSISAGEIPNLIYNIDGAVGVFGSFATDTVRTKVTRRPGY